MNPPAMNFENPGAPAVMKRLKKEYEDIVKNHELMPSNVLANWEAWDNKNDTLKMPLQWKLAVDGKATLVVHFPTDYPFERPYYYVETKGGKLVDMKQFFVVAAKNSETSSVSELGDDAVRFLAQVEFSPAVTVAYFVTRVLNDPVLSDLLSSAPTFEL